MGWYQQGASVGVAIILIPQVIGLLSTEETAVWFLCQSLLGIVALAKFGVPFTIARQIAYSKAASGDSVDAWEGDFVVFRKGWDGISEIFVLARIIFHFVSLVGISICLIVGEVILPMGQDDIGRLACVKAHLVYTGILSHVCTLFVPLQLFSGRSGASLLQSPSKWDLSPHHWD